MSTFFTSQEQYNEFKSAWTIAVNSPRRKFHLKPFDEWFAKDTYKGPTDGLEEVKRYWISKGTGRMKVDGWVKAEHYLLYNILRGKPLHTGFNPVTNSNKTYSWLSNMNKFYLTVIALENRVEWAQSLIKDDKAMLAYRKKHRIVSVVEKLNLFLKGINEDMDLADNEKFISLVNNIRKYGKRPTAILSPESKKWRQERIDTFLEPFNGTVTLKMLGEVDVEQLRMIRMFNRGQKENYWLKSI